MEISTFEYSNSKCTENMSRVRKDLWYNFFHQQLLFWFCQRLSKFWVAQPRHPGFFGLRNVSRRWGLLSQDYTLLIISLHHLLFTIYQFIISTVCFIIARCSSLPHHCLAKELVRCKSLTMLPIVCMHVCMPACLSCPTLHTQGAIIAP